MKVFCVAGQPQSGSTFVFNSLRLLAMSAYGDKYVFSCDLNLRSIGIICNKQPEVLIIKTHSRELLSILLQSLEEFGVETKIITTCRPPISCAASHLKRRQMQQPNLASIREEPWLLFHYLNVNMLLYSAFFYISDLEVSFREIVKSPRGVIEALSLLLCGEIDAAHVSEALASVNEISSSVKGRSLSLVDETLLTSFHQTSLSERDYFYGYLDLFGEDVRKIAAWALQPFHEHFNLSQDLQYGVDLAWTTLRPWELMTRAVSYYCSDAMEDCFALVALIEKHREFCHGTEDEELCWMMQSKYYGYSLRERIANIDLSFYSTFIEAVGISLS